jgi:multicomponent Na+:H+ antiporter subunit D
MSYLFLLVPFLLLLILNLFPYRKMEKIAFWTSMLIFVSQTLLAFISVFLRWNIYWPEKLLGFNLYFDQLAYFLLFTVGLMAGVALLVGHLTIKYDHERFNFKNLILVALIGMNGIAMVRDLFSLYVFIEVTAIATFILIALQRDRFAIEGVLKYLILSVVASTLMLSSIALFLLFAGGLSFPVLRAAAAASSGNFIIPSAIGLFLCGLFIKSGLFPFHGWLPDAYTSAPASVSVFLAGIVTKASGIFALTRFLTSITGFSPVIESILLLVGAMSVVVGALAAIGQKDMKRMLAYSSISQMGYIILGLGVGTKLGIFAALFHFLNHALFKGQLFVNAAAVEEQLGTRDMQKMGGLAQNMPVTGTTSLIASLSAAGIPPLAGFWSKLLIIISLWLTAQYTYAFVAILASVITLGYFLSFQRQIFFGKINEELSNIKEADIFVVLPAVILSSLTVFIGLCFPLLMRMFFK